MTRKLMVTMIAGAVIAFAACGGDDEGDEMSLDDYFTQLSSDVSAYITANDAEFTTLNESDDLDELKSAFAAIPENLQTLLDNIDELSPPEEAADAQADAVAAGEAFLAVLEDVNENAQTTDNVDAFIATAGNDDLQQLSENFNATCPPLQAVADENNVDVDLGCPE